MEIITVVVSVREQFATVSDFRDPRTRFWYEVGRQANARTSGASPEDFATESEQRLRTRLPQSLHRVMTRALMLGGDYEDSGRLAQPVQPARFVMTVEAIRYGSMSVDLGIPDIDAFTEMIGNNSETFEAIFGAYIPEAFNKVLPGDTDNFSYSVSIPKRVRNYIESKPAVATSAKADNSSAKDKGAAVLGSALRSPLIFPALLACFLWYYARQDMMEERKVTAGLIQTLVTEQTTVIGLLKARQEDDEKASKAINAEPPSTIPANAAKAKSQ